MAEPHKSWQIVSDHLASVEQSQCTAAARRIGMQPVVVGRTFVVVDRLEVVGIRLEVGRSIVRDPVEGPGILEPV